MGARDLTKAKIYFNKEYFRDYDHDSAREVISNLDRILASKLIEISGAAFCQSTSLHL